MKWSHNSNCDQVHGAIDTRSTYKCSFYAHIILRIIFQIVLLILKVIIILFLSDFILVYGTMLQSNYTFLPSFIISTRSVLNPINNDLISLEHAIGFAIYPTD